MKIIKEKDSNPMVAVTIRIPRSTLDEVTNLAVKNELSRQKLIAAILDEALKDKTFALKIKGSRN